VQLALQVLDLAGVHLRWAAVVVGVEGVVREGLQVGDVGVVAGGFEGFEGADDVIAGVVEDPVAVRQEKTCWLAGWAVEMFRVLGVRFLLTGSAARRSIYLVLVGGHVASSLLREGTPDMVELRR
jgi:hypothetical protein